MRKRILKGIHVMYMIVAVLAVVMYIGSIAAYSDSVPAIAEPATSDSEEADIIQVVQRAHSDSNEVKSDSPESSTDDTNVSSEPEATDEPDLYMELTDAEVRDFATLVFLEGGSESYECQLAIASVVVNRMTNKGLSLDEVMYEKNQFSPASVIHKYSPSDSTLQAVNAVLSDGPTIPEYVTYFRADYYHGWSDLIVPYKSIDHTYFSYDSRIKEMTK